MKSKSKIKTYITLFLAITFSIIDNSYAQLFWNQAASITSSANSFVSYPNSTALNITGNFTVEAWVNRSSAGSGLLGVVYKSKTLFKYGMTIQNTGRVQIAANNSNRIISRTSTAIPVNTWTHVSGTFNASTFTFKIYINGVLDTSAITSAASVPASNTDSLFIGNAGITTPFSGLVDEVRIWNRELSNAEINQYKLTSLGATGSIYDGLVLSTTFEDANSSGTDFSISDMSGITNGGFSKNVTAIDMSDNPSTTVAQNDCLQFDGNNDYVAGADNAALSPTGAITMECWVYPQVLSICSFLSKGSSTTPDYALTMVSVISAVINGTVISGASQPTQKQWTHIAFTYTASSGKFIFYRNGILIDSGTQALGNITNGTDSLYIGGGPGSIIDLNGYIDEVRIANYAKSQEEIVQYLYESIDEANDPSTGGTINTVYNFDGLALDNANAGGPRMFFKNNAKFSHSSAVANQPVSPLNRADALNFSKGFYLKTSNKRIPSTGTLGSMVDSISVNLNQTITDVNFYVALNHQNSANLEITLVAPNGDSVKVFDNNTSSGNSDNVVTIFDDNADSTLVSAKYINFSSNIKPVNNMNSIFAGDKSIGKWRIRINDITALDTGMVFAWGVQINNQTQRDKNLNLSALVQGFFNTTTGLMVPDTVKVFLRNSVSPFAKIDSASAVLNNIGDALVSFKGTTIQDNVNYYIQVNHRNSIETWSSLPQKFTNSELIFNFRNSIANAFGGNMMFVAGSPARFGFFSGDQNQNGVIDLTDVINTSNDATLFTAGYKSTDMNGDNTTDLTDVIITHNNSIFFIVKITP